MYGVDRSLCFGIDIDIGKPLRRVVNVMAQGKHTRVDIRYIKLLDFYYIYDMLERVTRDCDHYDLRVLETNFQYGEW